MIIWQQTGEGGSFQKGFSSVMTVLNGCFTQALKNGLIERNPIAAATLPRQKSDKRYIKTVRSATCFLGIQYHKIGWVFILQ